MNKIKVKAPEGKTCPWPGRPGVVIGQKPVLVSLTHLVRRLLSDGSLEAVKATEPVRKKSNSKKEDGE